MENLNVNCYYYLLLWLLTIIIYGLFRCLNIPDGISLLGKIIYCGSITKIYTQYIFCETSWIIHFAYKCLFVNVNGGWIIKNFHIDEDYFEKVFQREKCAW